VTTFKRTTGLLALAACLLAAGCGSDDGGTGIPRKAAAALDNQLDSIQSRFEFPGGAACADIADGDDPNTKAVQRTLDNLPSDVDQDLRDALQQGFDRLFQLVDEQCKKPQTETQTETVTEPPPPPTETQTETTPPETTETTPPPTETTEPPPTDTGEQVPPGQGGNAPGAQGGSGGNGQGGSGGNGQGGNAGGAEGGPGGGALVPGGEG
jgi:hypothetical protein